MSKQKTGELNLLLIRQAYLVRKLQLGMFEYLAELNCVQAEIVRWHRDKCEKVKFQSRCEELNSAENVRIYHHKLHKRNLHRSLIMIMKLHYISRFCFLYFTY